MSRWLLIVDGRWLKMMGRTRPTTRTYGLATPQKKAEVLVGQRQSYQIIHQTIE